MTHSLHRLGNTENLQDDFVVLAMSAKGINETGSARSLREFLEIAFEFEPINAGDMKTGNILTTSKEEIYENIQDVSIVHAVFTEESIVAAFLKRLDEADLGVSVVVSGLLDRVKAVGDSVDVHQHTVNCSGGIWGKVEKLPSQEVLEITTMCGHGMIGSNLVKHYATLIKKGRMTAQEAARKIGEPCVCGIFNIERAAKLIQAMADSDFEEHPMGQGQTETAVNQ